MTSRKIDFPDSASSMLCRYEARKESQLCFLCNQPLSIQRWCCKRCVIDFKSTIQAIFEYNHSEISKDNMDDVYDKAAETYLGIILEEKISDRP